MAETFNLDAKRISSEELLLAEQRRVDYSREQESVIEKLTSEAKTRVFIGQLLDGPKPTVTNRTHLVMSIDGLQDETDVDLTLSNVIETAKQIITDFRRSVLFGWLH